jgi:hypothetical protein
MQWSREDATLLWLNDVGWYVGWKKDAGELTLSKLFELTPECAADGCVGTGLPQPDCFFDGRSLTAGMATNEYYLVDDLTISEDEYTRVHTLVVCDDETCPAGASYIAAYPSYIARLGEQTGCGLFVPPLSVLCYDADISYGLAAGAGGRTVALLSGMEHPEKIIILHRDETSYKLVPFQELPLDIGDLPGYEAKLECAVGYQAPVMVLSPDGGELFVVGETCDSTHAECAGVLLHFHARKE